MEISGPTPEPTPTTPFSEVVNSISRNIIIPALNDQLYNSSPLFFQMNRSDGFRADIKQNRQWARIGAGILPWIPATQTRVRDLRSRARLALGEFLIDHGVIEVPEDDNDYW